MQKTSRRWPLVAGLLLSLSLAAAVPTSQRRATGDPEWLFSNLPGSLGAQVAALGKRAAAPEQARVLLSGEFLDEQERRRPVRVTLQLPELVRLDGISPGGPALSRTPSEPGRRLAQREQRLLDTFATDTAEGMFTAIKAGAAVQVAGLRAGPGAAIRGYTGPLYDIYEVTEPPQEDPSTARLRRYFFNSETGLLASTRYWDETLAADVETRFPDWQTVDGSSYPARVDRLENGRLVFSFRFNKFTAAGRQDPSRLPVIDEPVEKKEEQ
jgi:hypothetical protein